MIPVPLPTTITGSRLVPRAIQFTNNLIPSQGALLSRPSCTKKEAVAVGQPRGMFTFKDELYSVFGNILYKGETDLERHGFITGTEQISVAMDYEKAAIATGEDNYILGEQLVKVTDRDLPPCRSVCVVDGIFVWVASAGDFVLWSEIGRASQIRATSFLDAEQLPDRNEIGINIRNDLYVLGRESIERFRQVGDPDYPFVRVNNSIVSVGYVGGLIETKDSFLFIGKDKDGGFAVFAYDAASITQISNESINEILNTEYSINDLRIAQGQRFNWHGKDCYVFSIKDRDFIVTTGGGAFLWGYLSSGTKAGYFEFNKWGYRNSKFHNGKWYCQRDDGLYEFTYDSQDTDGNYIRSFRVALDTKSGQTLTLDSLRVGVVQTPFKGSIGLSMSRDGVIYNEPFFVSTGGQFDNNVIFCPDGGLGYYDGYAGIQLSTSSNISFAVDSLVLE